jgi:hypothetical protein
LPDRNPAGVKTMKTLALAAALGASFLFGQVEQSTTQSTSTTQTKHHGKKSKTDMATTTTKSDEAGTSTDASSATVKTKKKHGKQTTSTTSTDTHVDK